MEVDTSLPDHDANELPSSNNYHPQLVLLPSQKDNNNNNAEINNNNSNSNNNNPPIINNGSQRLENGLAFQIKDWKTHLTPSSFKLALQVLNPATFWATRKNKNPNDEQQMKIQKKHIEWREYCVSHPESFTYYIRVCSWFIN